MPRQPLSNGTLSIAKTQKILILYAFFENLGKRGQKWEKGDSFQYL
jgi:hypothetical protein